MLKCHRINDEYYRGKFKRVSALLTYFRYSVKHYILGTSRDHVFPQHIIAT